MIDHALAADQAELVGRATLARQQGDDAAVERMCQEILTLSPGQPDAVWLIGLSFPAAPLIHVQRHPLDVVLSVYSNNLTHGFHCAATLEAAARHYMLIDGLVEHYKTQMDLHYLSVRYEDLVRDQNGTFAGFWISSALTSIGRICVSTKIVATRRPPARLR